MKYVREQPLQAYDTGTSDVANFMKWLETMKGELADYLAARPPAPF